MNTEENKTCQNRGHGSDKPRFLGVVEGFINSKYLPAKVCNPDDPRRFRIMTSQEIAIALADMVDMELNDVAEAMMFLGYRTAICDDRVGWLLERRSV